MKNGLQIGVVDVFQKFLEAMNEYALEHKDPVVKKLGDDINQDSRGPSRAGIPYKSFGIPRNLAQNLESCLGIWNLLVD